MPGDCQGGGVGGFGIDWYISALVQTAENVAALNVDYIAWIITVLGAITVILPSFLI